MRRAFPTSTASRMWKRRSDGGTSPSVSSPAWSATFTPGYWRAEPADHLHVQSIVTQRDPIVLRRDQIDAHDAALGLRELEREDELREHDLRVEDPVVCWR